MPWMKAQGGLLIFTGESIADFTTRVVVDLTEDAGGIVRHPADDVDAQRVGSGRTIVAFLRPVTK